MDEYQFRTMRVEDLKPGMILNATAVTEAGRVVLRAGTQMNARAIEGLKTWNIMQVDVRIIGLQPGAVSPFDDEIEKLLGEKQSNLCESTVEAVEEIAEPAKETALEIPQEPEVDDYAAENLPESFVDKYMSALAQVKYELSMARFQKNNFNPEHLKALIPEVLQPLLEDKAIFWKLQFIEHKEDYLYHHSIDVAILAGCIGEWMGCTAKRLESLMWGALLHDIGKTLVPLNIINKSGSLTAEEWNIAQLHAVRGYKYLRKNYDMPHEIHYCVLQHHERMDGSGYPLSLPGKKIDVCGRIIAIADTYSAMTSMRCYGKRRTSYDAAATLQSDMFGKLDSQVCMQFLGRLRQFFQGNMVRLNDGRDAEVVYLNPSDDSRPMVRTVDGAVIDLSHARDFSIRRVLY